MSLLTTASFRAAGLGLREDDEQRRASFDRQAKSSLPKPPSLPKPKGLRTSSSLMTPSLEDRSDEKSILRKTGDAALDSVGALGNILDLPGSVGRDLLTLLPGGPAPANPIDQLLSPTKSRNRTTGEDFMKGYGLMDDDTNAFARFAGGLAFEVLTDPLTYLSGGLTAAAKGGSKGAIASRSLKKTGLLDNIDVYTGLGKRQAAMSKSAKDVLDSDVLTKTLKTDSDKVAAKNRFDEEVTNAIKGDKEFQKRAQGLSETDRSKLIDDIKASTLSDSYYRFKVPGFKEVKFGGTGRAKLQDDIGEAMRYNPLTVGAMSRLSKNYQDLGTAQSQRTRRRFAVELDGASALAREKMHQNVKALDPVLNKFDDLSPEEAKEASNQVGLQVTKYLEDIGRPRAKETNEAGIEFTKSTFEESRDEIFSETREEFRDKFLKELADQANDASSDITEDTYRRVSALLAPREGKASVLDDIKDLLDEVVAEAPKYGDDITQLQDEFATYMPRVRQTSRGTIGTSDTSRFFDAENPFSLRRSDIYRNLPGGTAAINRMSIDQEFAGVTSKKALNRVKEDSREYTELYNRFKEKYAQDLPVGEIDELTGKVSDEAEAKMKDLFKAITQRDLQDVKRGVTLYSVDPGASVTRSLETAYRTRVKRDMIGDAIRETLEVDPTTSGRFSTKLRVIGEAFLPDDMDTIENLVGMSDELGKRLARALGKSEEDVTKKFKFDGPDGADPPINRGDGGSPPPGTDPPRTAPDPPPVSPDAPTSSPETPPAPDAPIAERSSLVSLLDGDTDTLLREIAGRNRQEVVDEVSSLSKKDRNRLAKSVSGDIKLTGSGVTKSKIGSDIFDSAQGIVDGKKASQSADDVVADPTVRTGALSPGELLESMDPEAESFLLTHGFVKYNQPGTASFLIRIPQNTIDDLRSAGGLPADPLPQAKIDLNSDQINGLIEASRGNAHPKKAEIIRPGEVTDKGMNILRDDRSTVEVPSTFVETTRSLHGDDVQMYIVEPHQGRGTKVAAFKETDDDLVFVAEAPANKIRSAEDALGKSTPGTEGSKASADVKFGGDNTKNLVYSKFKQLADSLPDADMTDGSRVELLRVGELHRYPDDLLDESIRYLSENKPQYLQALKKSLVNADGEDAAQLLGSINRAMKLEDGSVLSDVGSKVRSASPNRTRVMLGLSRVFGDLEASETLAVFDATARAFSRATGRNADEFYAGIDDIADMSKRPGGSDDGIRGAIRFAKDGKATIYGGKGSDISTSIHEMAHYSRRVLGQVDPEFARLVDEAVGSSGGRLSREQEEVFARGFETYLSEGNAPTPELQSIYSRIKKFITDVYRGLKDTPLEEKISPELRAAYARMQGAVKEAKPKPTAKKTKYTNKHRQLAKALGLRVNQVKKESVRDIESALESARETLEDARNDDEIVFQLLRGREGLSDSQQRANVYRRLLEAIDLDREGLDYAAYPGFDELVADARTMFPGVFRSQFGDTDVAAFADDEELLWSIMTGFSGKEKVKKSGNRYFNLKPKSSVMKITDPRVIERADEMNLLDPILNPPKADPTDFDPDLLGDGDEFFQPARGAADDSAGGPSPLFREEDMAIANATSRSRGAVGAKAVVPKAARELIQEGDRVLDFGAGKDAMHTKMLREEGFDVTAHEFGDNQKPGIHDPEALEKGPYDLVYASNVINVQNSDEMLGNTLDQIAAATNDSGTIVINLPGSPRKGAWSGKNSEDNPKLLSFLEERFEEVSRKGQLFTAKSPIRRSDSGELFQASRQGVEENITNQAGDTVLQVRMPDERFMSEEGDVVIRAFRQATPEELSKVVSRVYSDYLLDLDPKLEAMAESIYGVKNGDWGTSFTRDGATKTSREWLAHDFVRFASGDLKPPSMLGSYFDGIKRMITEMVGKEVNVPTDRKVRQFLDDLVGSDYRGEMQTVYDVMRNLKNAGLPEQEAMVKLLTSEETQQATRNALRIRVENRIDYLNNGGLQEIRNKIDELKLELQDSQLDQETRRLKAARLRKKETQLEKAENLVEKNSPDQWLDEYERTIDEMPKEIDGVSTDVSDAARLRQARLPSWMAEDLHKINLNAARLEEMQDIAPLIKFLDNYTSIFKTSVTALHPGFHFRNLASGFFHNVLNDVHDPRFSKLTNPLKAFTQPYTDARQLMFGKKVDEANKIPGFESMSDAEASEKIAEELFIHEVIEQPGTYRDIPGQQASSIYDQIIGPGQSAGEINNMFEFAKTRFSPLPAVKDSARKSQSKTTNFSDTLKNTWNKLSESGRAIGDSVEFQHRVGGFIALRRQGYSAAEAANRVNLLHVDYSNLSRAEKDYLRRVIPFYSFSRGMAKYLTQELTTRPAGPVGQTIRAQNKSRDRDVATPTYVSKGLSIPIGQNEDGTRHFLTGLGLMHEQPVQQISPLLSGDPGRAAFSVLSNVNPALKAPLEMAFDESTFQEGVDGGVDLDDMRPPVGQMLSNLMGKEDGQPVRLGKTLEVLAGSSPASRYISTISQMADDRKGLFGRVIAPMSGFRVTSVSPERQDAVLRERAEQYLQDIGARKFEKRYIPEGVYEAMSDEDKEVADKYMALIEVLGTRSKDRRKVKEEQKKGLIDG